ncbi:GNAT family N-acetyltransferase [Arenibacter sp. GZD96]|uniref:GNAT family N-acetyltransferase n=1 Tax=Aurantibrevibacter litoralis TaxID=3106030 RepID=UPI002AFF866B|nr:GNAT family N-acetyltransferase [Arenibacter sp. GZD-96]MEA1787264.1 GNAT family N-acetyltransferase [Arenibacter sp. GZD-96]
MIRHAKISEIAAISSLTQACTKMMEQNGIYQWNYHYPSAVVFEKDIRRNELYLLEKQNTIIGCIAISSLMDLEYETVTWVTPNNHSYYIHRLAIAPNYQRQGYAHQLMDFAEDLARNKGLISVRLDTFSQNSGNQKFYESRGYQKLETIYFPHQSKHPFYCYELVL